MLNFQRVSMLRLTSSCSCWGWVLREWHMPSHEKSAMIEDFLCSKTGWSSCIWGHILYATKLSVGGKVEGSSWHIAQLGGLCPFSCSPLSLSFPIPTVWKLRWIFLISTPFEMLKSIYLQIPSFLGTPKSTLSLPSPPCRLGQHLKSYPSLPRVPRCGSTVSPLALTQSIFLSIHDSTVVGLWDIVRYDIYIYVCVRTYTSHRIGAKIWNMWLDNSKFTTTADARGNHEGMASMAVSCGWIRGYSTRLRWINGGTGGQIQGLDPTSLIHW